MPEPGKQKFTLLKLPGVNRAFTTTRPAILLIVSGMMAGCGGSAANSEDSPPATATKSVAVNDELLDRIYSTGTKVPDGFFVDERANTPRSYSVYHVKDESLSFELCTNDFDVARNWEEADNSSRAVNGTYAGAYENELYFEFIRELTYPDATGNVQGVTSPGFARVFKCQNVDRNGVDRNLRYGYGGVLNSRPLTGASVRRFVEYLWQFTYFDNPKKTVLESSTSEYAETIEHTLQLAFVVNQGLDRCDRIEIFDWVFRVARATGQVDRRFDFLVAFDARVVNGIPERCQ